MSFSHALVCVPQLHTALCQCFGGLFHFNSSIATYHATQELIFSYTSIGVAFIEFLAILTFHARHRMNLKWLNIKYCKICPRIQVLMSIQIPINVFLQK